MNELNGHSVRSDQNPAFWAGATLTPCIGVLELGSVARGVEVADALLKEASVELVFSTPVQPGKYVTLLTGSVEDVAAAIERAVALAGSDIVDRLHLPQVDVQVLEALQRSGGVIEGTLDAVGLVETATVASAIAAADLALDTATVDLLDLRIANGLGGRSFFTVTGEVSDVRSAVFEASRQAESAGRLVRQVVIPQPHEDLVRYL